MLVFVTIYRTVNLITCFIFRKLLKDIDIRRKYLLLITNSFVIDHPSLKWCPAKGCDNAVLAINADNREPVQCSCGHYFWSVAINKLHYRWFMVFVIVSSARGILTNQ